MTSPLDNDPAAQGLFHRLGLAGLELVDAAQAALAQACSRFAQAAPANDRAALESILDNHPAAAAQLARVWSWSEFALDACCRRPGEFVQMLAEGELDERSELVASLAGPDNLLLEQLQRALGECTGEEACMQLLRRTREREQLRIIWLEINELVSLEVSTLALSRMADAMLEVALAHSLEAATKNYGEPLEASTSQVAQLVVLGMGKLGANELNLSSDIDLIFAFTEAGDTNGDSPISNQEFFSRVGKTLIRLLDVRTADGFVFRVDMRLRPNGQSGPLVLSFAATEDYYQQHGREWERYALIKARVAAGSRQQGEALLASLQPFVFRRYLDFGAIEALRDMKALIEQQVARQNLQDNIKLGSGGIREAEFVAQSFQLIPAGRDERLRQPNFLQVLAELESADYLPAEQAGQLAESYRLLRRVEHRLQARRDEQTQLLPADSHDLALLAWNLGYADAAAFSGALDQSRQRVAAVFANIVADDAPDENDAQSTEPDFWQWWWQLPLSMHEEHSVDEGEVLQNADQQRAFLQQLLEFKQSPRVLAMDNTSRARLDRFMPLLLAATAKTGDPLLVLPRLITIVDAVLRRTAYLALLLENRQALVELVTLCERSPWIADQLASFPLLLDELLDRRQLLNVPDTVELQDELQQQILRVPAGDTEQAMDTLRQFKLVHGLRVAACQIFGILPLMRISDYLTWLAEVILQSVLNIAWTELVERHGLPTRVDGSACGSKDSPSGFIIVGYGKLGGIELGPASDLDLVFIHDTDSQAETQATQGQRQIANSVFFARFGQRIIHYLTTQTMSGALYEVDMRLRPSGASGMLVSSFDAFERYQREQAWTWEHQALVRARVVAGDHDLARRFAQLRQALVSLPRDARQLQVEVQEMRDKMLSHQGQADSLDTGSDTTGFDLKQSRGGMIDIEFIVQYLVLAHAREHPELARWTDKMRILDALAETGILATDDAQALQQAFQTYRSRGHLAALSQLSAEEQPEQELRSHRESVARLWQRTFS